MVLQIQMINEILSKENKRVSHVVVMGIGEPFDNYDNLLDFLRIINDPKGLEIGSRHITVSTCGIVPKIIEYSDFELQVNLAISLHFANDDKIQFCENYREYQCYKFGDNAIFFGHGDNNFKRLVRSIPAEFYQEWGSSKYRELHLGHLHSEITVDDQSGMITRRISSPSGVDAWHYGERYLGATQKHQLFIWDRHEGLKGIKYITFDNKYPKDKVKKLTK